MSRFDLAGNPLPDADVPVPPPAPEPPLPAGQPWATVPQPPPVSYLPPEDAVGSFDEVPPAIAHLKWNWGAFFLPPLWCASNGYRVVGYLYDLLILLLVLSPFLYGPVYGGRIFWGLAIVMFDIGLYLGKKGNEIAWRNRAFVSSADFFSVQRGWMIAGFAVALPLDLLLFGWMSSLTLQELHRQQAQQAQQERVVPARRAVNPSPAPLTYQPSYLPAPPSPVVIMRGSNPGGNRMDSQAPPMDVQSPAPTVLSQPTAPGNTQNSPATNPQSAAVPSAGGPPSEATGATGGATLPPSPAAPPTMAPVASGQIPAPPPVAIPPAGQPSVVPPPPAGAAPGQ